MRQTTQVAVLSWSDGFYTTRRLAEAARALGAEVTRIDPARCVVSAGAGPSPLTEGGRPIPTPDVLIPRLGSRHIDWTLGLVRALVGAGAWSPASPEALDRAADKMATAQRLAAAGVPVVPTVAVRARYHVPDALALAGGPPWILKLAHGSQGRRVTRAPDEATARATADLLLDLGHTVLVQPWAGVDPARDRRVLVVGGRAVAQVERQAPEGEFRSNVHLGAAARDLPLDGPERDVAEAAAAAVGLPLCGVDLLPGPQGPRVLEVNGSPGLEGTERATGAALAETILRWCLDAAAAAAR